MNKRRDWIISKLASIIVWCEDLQLAIQTHRFARAIEQAKATPSATKIVQTKIVDQEGYVLSTLIDVGHMEQMPNGGYRSQNKNVVR